MSLPGSRDNALDCLRSTTSGWQPSPLAEVFQTPNPRARSAPPSTPPLTLILAVLFTSAWVRKGCWNEFRESCIKSNSERIILIECGNYYFNLLCCVFIKISYVFRWFHYIQSIHLLFKVQSHLRNGLGTLLNNINTLIKQSDTDITEWTEIVRGKQQVTTRIDLNSEGG